MEGIFISLLVFVSIIGCVIYYALIHGKFGNKASKITKTITYGPSILFEEASKSVRNKSKLLSKGLSGVGRVVKGLTIGAIVVPLGVGMAVYEGTESIGRSVRRSNKRSVNATSATSAISTTSTTRAPSVKKILNTPEEWETIIERFDITINNKKIDLNMIEKDVKEVLDTYIKGGIGPNKYYKNFVLESFSKMDKNEGFIFRIRFERRNDYTQDYIRRLFKDYYDKEYKNGENIYKISSIAFNNTEKLIMEENK